MFQSSSLIYKSKNVSLCQSTIYQAKNLKLHCEDDILVALTKQLAKKRMRIQVFNKHVAGIRIKREISFSALQRNDIFIVLHFGKSTSI